MESSDVSDIISINSMGSMASNLTNTNYTSKKYQIELNIKLLYVKDPKYVGEAFKIYWTRGKRKIDTRTAVAKQDTQIAKFSDKFQMKTVLQYDEERDEFKPKHSDLQVYHLEKKTDDGDQPQDKNGKIKL